MESEKSSHKGVIFYCYSYNIVTLEKATHSNLCTNLLLWSIHVHDLKPLIAGHWSVLYTEQVIFGINILSRDISERVP